MLLVLCGGLSLFLASHQSSCSASAQIQLRFGKSRHDKHNSVQGGKKNDRTQTELSEEVFWRNLFKQEVPWSTTMDVFFFFTCGHSWYCSQNRTWPKKHFCY